MTLSTKHLQTPDHTYLPSMARIARIADMTAREKYYLIEVEQPLNHKPGQFVMVSRLGVGEAPISISNPPAHDNTLELIIRKAGSLTGVLHHAQPGDMVGIRGPYGNGFDLEEFFRQGRALHLRRPRAGAAAVADPRRAQTREHGPVGDHPERLPQSLGGAVSRGGPNMVAPAARPRSSAWSTKRRTCPGTAMSVSSRSRSGRSRSIPTPPSWPCAARR
ncbi:MAG: FAD-binding oxidoreductase [Deltaproteobacteria bacterium]|nr:FAD-binding oxidoreductase [Deltaproteobacteria bacterium]